MVVTASDAEPAARSSVASENVPLRVMRAWAKRNGYSVASTGVLPVRVRAAYVRAHQPERSSTSTDSAPLVSSGAPDDGLDVASAALSPLPDARAVAAWIARRGELPTEQQRLALMFGLAVVTAGLNADQLRALREISSPGARRARGVAGRARVRRGAGHLVRL